MFTDGHGAGLGWDHLHTTVLHRVVSELPGVQVGAAVAQNVWESLVAVPAAVTELVTVSIVGCTIKWPCGCSG